MSYVQDCEVFKVHQLKSENDEIKVGLIFNPPKNSYFFIENLFSDSLLEVDLALLEFLNTFSEIFLIAP